MATLRELRTRVSSIRNIQRVTNAMQMVAAAKMRRAQESIEAARPYAVHLDRVLSRLRSGSDSSQHPLLGAAAGERTLFVVVTADRGLCGAFNGSLCRKAQAEWKSAEDPLGMVTIGRKGLSFFNNRGIEILGNHADVMAGLEFNRAVQIGQDLMRRFSAGEVDRIITIFCEFRSISQLVPVATQLLPIPPQAAAEGEGHVEDYIFEPDPAALLTELVPRHVNFQIWRSLLESNACEQAARMTAMDNATKNAGDIVDELTRAMNKERQASITLELMDIIGGAEAVA